MIIFANIINFSNKHTIRLNGDEKYELFILLSLFQIYIFMIKFRCQWSNKNCR